MTTRLAMSSTPLARIRCEATLISAPSAPCQRPAHAAYPTVHLSGYDVPCPTYNDHALNQIYSGPATPLNQVYSGPATPYYTPNTLPFKVFSPEQNKVFVYDGSMWNEFDLEKVFS